MSVDDAFAHQPSIPTARLLLRPLRVADAEAVFAFKSDIEVTRHYGQEPHRSVDETRAWIQRRVDDHARRAVLFWAFALTGDDRAIGAGCLWNFDAGFRCAELGYELHPSYWNRGLMTEAASAILDYAFHDLSLHRIEANPYADNEASVKLLRKLGFKEEGRLRERHFFRGQYLDQLYFALLEEEWRSPGHGPPGRAAERP